jgi:hypothetical protein
VLREPAGAVEPILFPGLTDGAKDLRLRWKLVIDTGGQRITQMAPSSTNTSTQILDGVAPIGGASQAFAVDSNVTANYDGQTVTIGQIAVATEANTA